MDILALANQARFEPNFSRNNAHLKETQLMAGNPTG